MSAKLPSEQTVTISDCPCGQRHLFRVAHYDRVIVGCGRPYWALSPKRDGALKMFLHPGPNLTRQQMEALQPATTEKTKAN